MVLRIFITVTICVAAPVASQTPRVLKASAKPACSTCKILLTKIATLGSFNDSVGPVDSHVFLQQSTDGRYYVAEFGGANRFVFVYSDSGELVRTLGRRGAGPGEFNLISGLATKGDSVVVWESTGKFSVFDHRGELVLNGRMPFAPQQLVALQGQGWIGWLNIRSAGLAGLIHHFFDSNLKYVKSVASANLKPDKQTPQQQRHISLWRSGFLVLDFNALSLEFYTPAGGFMRAVELDAPWLSLDGLKWITFKPMHGKPGELDRGPATPPPILRAARIDDQELVWVLGAVEDREWRRRGVDWVGPNAIKRDPGFWEKTWDGMVDIIDSRSGALIHRERLPFYAHVFVGKDLLMRPVQDSDGMLRIEIWRAVLNGWTR